MSFTNEVKVSFLTEKELEEYRKKAKPKKWKKEKKAADWRWPQNRK